MQGNLSDIDVRSLLQLLEFNQRTGELFVETDDGRYWSLFFLKGRLAYATSSSGAMERFQDCVARFNLTETFVAAQSSGIQNGSANHPAAIAPASAPEYGVLCAMVEEHKLSLAQAQQLIRLAAEEIVFDLAGFRAGAFIFEATTGISPALIGIDTTKLLAEVDRRLDEWQKLKPLVQSGEQRPLILNHGSLQQQLSAPVYAQLSETMNGERSLRVIARILGRDMVTVARALVPYLQQGILRLEGMPEGAAPAPEQTRPARLACIDDSISIQKSIEFCLQGRGYDFKAISSPLAAINELFAFKPDLILLDIAMPRLDGYELCGMLRKSNLFRQTPVIMLTGKDGFVDRVRARMAGATEYLTKPFGERELLDLVEKYLGSRTASFTSARI